MRVLKKQLVVNTLDTEVTQVCRTTNIVLKYNQHINLTNNKAAIDLRLQSIKKYQRCLTQIADKLSHFQDFFSIFTIFVNEACINFNEKIQLDKYLRFRQDRDQKQVFSLFIKLHSSIKYQKIDENDIADMSKLIKKFVHYSFK